MYYRSLEEEIEIFTKGQKRRLEEWPQFALRRAAFESLHGGDSLKAIESDGFYVQKNLLNRATLTQIKKEMDVWVSEGIHLRQPKHVKGFDPSGHWTEAKHLALSDLAKGANYFRNETNSVDIEEPLLNFPELVSVIFNPFLLDVASAYLGSFPSVGFLKMRRSFVNKLPRFDTNFFHVDGNSAKIVKAFIYLADVDKNGGPLCYVKGSHRKRFEGWLSKDRWTHDEMKAVYGEDTIIPIEARAGDVIIGDMSGLHCAGKPVAEDRSIVIVNYVVHDEYGGGGDRIKIRQSDFDRLDPRQQAAADLLLKVAA